MEMIANKDTEVAQYVLDMNFRVVMLINKLQKAK